MLLKVALRVVEIGNLFHLGPTVAHETQERLTGCLETAVNIDGPDDRLEGIRQGGTASTPAAGILTTTENQVLPQKQPTGLRCQRGPIHQLSPRLSQSALTQPRETLVQLRGDRQLDDGIAQKLETLVVILFPSLLVDHRRMGQRQ